MDRRHLPHSTPMTSSLRTAPAPTRSGRLPVKLSDSFGCASVASCLIYASPFFSDLCKLFCNRKKLNLFTFNQFRTLSQKHPGVGIPLSPLLAPVKRSNSTSRKRPRIKPPSASCARLISEPMERSSGLRIGRILGIPIYLHASWVIIFSLITFSLAMQFTQEHPGWSTTQH